MGACLLCCPPAYLAFSWLLCPHPPRPALAERSSRREGGAPKFISPGAPPPAPRRRAAYGTYRDCRTSALRRETCGSPQERRQTVAHSFASAARVQPRGCKGRSPLHKITLSIPLPAGKGVGGMGAGKQAKVKRQAGNKEGKPPRRVPQWQGQQATKKASPPAALARPAPGERTISNAEVPLPRSPLSLATGTAHR